MMDVLFFVFFFKQKTAYEMRISDWSSDVCSSDLPGVEPRVGEEDRDEQDRDRADLALDLFGQLAARHTGAEDEAAEHRVDARRVHDESAEREEHQYDRQHRVAEFAALLDATAVRQQQPASDAEPIGRANLRTTATNAQPVCR